MAETYPPPATGSEGDDAGMVIDTPSEDKGSRTALIPTEFFGDKELEPGTECTVRIERVLDGQVQVAYVPHEEGDAELGLGPEEGDPEMAEYMGGE